MTQPCCPCKHYQCNNLMTQPCCPCKHTPCMTPPPTPLPTPTHLHGHLHHQHRSIRHHPILTLRHHPIRIPPHLTHYHTLQRRIPLHSHTYAAYTELLLCGMFKDSVGDWVHCEWCFCVGAHHFKCGGVLFCPILNGQPRPGWEGDKKRVWGGCEERGEGVGRGERVWGGCEGCGEGVGTDVSNTHTHTY